MSLKTLSLNNGLIQTIFPIKSEMPSFLSYQDYLKYLYTLRKINKLYGFGDWLSSKENTLIPLKKEECRIFPTHIFFENTFLDSFSAALNLPFMVSTSHRFASLFFEFDLTSYFKHVISSVIITLPFKARLLRQDMVEKSFSQCLRSQFSVEVINNEETKGSETKGSETKGSETKIKLFSNGWLFDSQKMESCKLKFCLEEDIPMNLFHHIHFQYLTLAHSKDELEIQNLAIKLEMKHDDEFVELFVYSNSELYSLDRCKK